MMHEHSDECFQSVTEIRRTIAVAKTITRGFSDLLIREKTTRSESNDVKGECVSTIRKSTQNHLLHFDGDAYVVPEEMRD